MAHNSETVKFKTPIQETFEESESIETDITDNQMQETEQPSDIGLYRFGYDGTVIPPQSTTPDLPSAFPHNRSEHPSASAESVPPPESCKENRIGIQLQDKLNQSTDRAGLCVICSCTRPPGLEPIENCSSSEKMTQCFGMELGYLTHRVDDMSSHDLESLLLELTNLRIPEACSKDFRLLFSFFGHGNAEQICLSDCNFNRSPIIERLQKMSRTLVKIILFDCCRTDSFPVTMSKPIPETQKLRDMPGIGRTTNWEMKSYSPRAERVNTLVIYATDPQCKAYYSCSEGCGLVTHHFTRLASSLDKPLLTMLTEVRKEVDKAIQQQEPFADISQVLNYNERIMGAADINLLAESKGSRRIAPTNPEVSITGFTAQFGWKIPGSVGKRIKFVYVKLNGKEMEAKMEGLADISLKHNESYTTSVVAVYEDDVKAESKKVYFKTPDLGCAEIRSLRLIKLFPLKAILEWQMDSEQKELRIDHFTVKSDHGILVPSCKEKEAQLSLYPGTKYTLTVETHYSGDIMSSSKQEFKYTTPTIDDMKPIVEIPEEPISDSIIVKVSDPPFFQKKREFHADNIELEKSFHIRRSQVGDEKNSDRYENHTILRDKLNPDPTQPHEIKLAGLQANTKYKVDCEMSCSSRDVLSCQKEFDSEPSRKQWMCCSVLFPLCLLLLFLLSIPFFSSLAFSGLPYKQYLHGNTDTKTHLAEQNDTVPCGSGNSRQDEGITVQAVLIGSDALDGTLIAAVTPQRDLKLYFKELTPYIMNKTHFLIPFQLLPIDNIPLWVGSIVSGYFCIENPSDVEQNATMYVFINKADADQFQSEGIAKNYVLSESIKIPPLKRENCFQNLNKGILVNTSGYYYFVIHVSSSDMTFRYNTTVLQKYPDINDYDNQKTFTCASDGNMCTQGPTYLPFPKRSITKSETVYIAICKAPLESTRTSHINQTYDLNVSAAPTIHILSKVIPHGWYDWVRASTALGILGLAIVLTVSPVVCCVACVCYRKRIFCNGYTCTCPYPPKRRRGGSRGGYEQFHNQS